MWATISMQILYILMTLSMSVYLERQNARADSDRSIVLEGVRDFRYAP